MNIQIGIILCLLLTMLTGTIAYVFFMIIKKITEKMLIIKTHYILLKVVIVCFLIPFCFGYELLRNLNVGWWTGYFSFSTEVLVAAANIVLVVWIAGIALNTIKVIKNYLHIKTALSVYHRYLEYDKSVLKEAKRQLHMLGRIRVYRGIFYDSPMASGIFRRKIYIPEREYSDDQMKYVFLHELIHHKHRDLLIIFLANILYVVYWFHPLWSFNIIQNQYYELMEDACDIDVCRISRDSDAYIKVLARLVLDAYESYDEVAAFLVEKKGDVIRRIERMGIYQAQRNVKKIFVILLSVALFLSSTWVVYAAENGVIVGYGKTYKVSWEGTDDFKNHYEENLLEEYYEETSIYDNNVVEYFDDSSLLYLNTVNINFSVSVGSEKRSSVHKLNKGDSIRVAVSMEPENKSMKVGIIKTDGSIRYVCGSGDIYHTFEIYEKGSYSFFIENSNDMIIEVSGYYKIL